jgi:hypothetical protein
MDKIDLIIDALENSKPINKQSSIPFDKHLKALAAARELKALKPVAWIYDWYGHKSAKEPRALVKDWIAAVYTEVSDPTIGAHNIRPLYTAPTRKEWVGLTDDEIWEADGLDDLVWGRNIEAKLKELNK